MKKTIILVAIFMLTFTAVASATRGGEGNNTGCNGVGNRNSPCQGQGGNGGNGGNGGDGGNINSTIKNTTANTNRNTNIGINANKNKNTNKNTNVGVNVSKNTNKVNNTNKIDNSNRNKVDVNNKVKNDVSNKQGQLQGQGQDQSQTARAKQGQDQAQSANNEGIVVEGDTIEDNSVYLAPPSTTPMVGTVSAQITTPFGGAGFSKDAKHAKLMTTIQFIDFMKKNKLIEEDRAKEDVLKVYDKLLRTVCGRSCATSDKEITGNGGNL